MSDPLKITERLLAGMMIGAADVRATHVPGTPPHWRLIGFTNAHGTEWLAVHDRADRVAFAMPRSELPALLRWMRARRTNEAAA